MAPQNIAGLLSKFLDPKKLNRSGRLILVITFDEAKHRKHYFEHRPQNENSGDT